MAEYKNSVSALGNVSVSKEDTAAEVRTGRVVFVDEDKYEKDAAYKAKVDKCVEEGFMRSDEAGSGGSGGGGSVLVVNIYRTGPTTTTVDKTYEEIKNAARNGIVVARIDYGDDAVDYGYLAYEQDDATAETICFYVGFNSTSTPYAVYISSDNTVEIQDLG